MAKQLEYPTPRRQRITFWLNVVLAAAGVMAVATLVFEYGFDEPPVSRGALHIIQAVVIGVFVLDRVSRLLLAPFRFGYLRQNWIDFALIFAAVAVAAVGLGTGQNVLSAGALYVVITQGYLLLALIVRGVNINLRFAGSGIHPTWLLIGSFAVMSLVGSGLLMLPASVRSAEKWYYDDALFTAVSATCVTGLVVRDTGTHFTPFGQAVILALIQLGGLGIMMFGTVLAMLVGKGLSVRTSQTIGHMLATEHVGRLGRALKFVLIVTLAMEAIGAVLFYPMFAAARDGFGRPMSHAQAVWHSVFHSVSSFCNAGFALYGDNMMQGVREGWGKPLREHWQIMGVMAPLIVLGGLGFPVLQDCARWAWSRVRRGLGRISSAARRRFPDRAPARLSLHAKLVLATSAVLLVVGAVGIVLVEKLPLRTEDVGGYHVQRRGLAAQSGGRLAASAVFQSVTARTAGFNTVRMDDLSHAGKLWMCGLMVIGGSPASTAGGMKTVTFVLLFVAAFSLLRRRGEVEAFRRSISADLIRKAIAVAALYLALVVVTTLLLAAAMKRYAFIDLLFEACSACGTVGLSTGITPKLQTFGKCVGIFAMYVGRLGPLTLLLAVTHKMRNVRYAYASENVVIG